MAINVVPVQLTMYSLSRLIRKMSDLYPKSHSVWHPVPPVPHLVQEYWFIFNAGSLGPCPLHMGKKPCRTVTDLGISLSPQWQHAVNIKHWSVPLLHPHMCLTFFSKSQLVTYQGNFSLIVMYKTVFSSHHVDLVAMTETAESLIQLALVGCCLWHRDLEVEKTSVSWYIAAPSPALLWHSWSLTLNPP